jgi:hypothetical protein
VKVARLLVLRETKTLQAARRGPRPGATGLLVELLLLELLMARRLRLWTDRVGRRSGTGGFGFGGILG